MAHGDFTKLVERLPEYVGEFICLCVFMVVRYLRGKFRKKLLTEENMEKVLLDGKEADVDLVIAGGKVVLKAVYAGHGGGATVELFVSSDYLLDKIAAAIPGSIDDAILAVAKEALKKV